MHQCFIEVVLWSVRLWFKTGKAWTGGPARGIMKPFTQSANSRVSCKTINFLLAGWDCTLSGELSVDDWLLQLGLRKLLIQKKHSLETQEIENYWFKSYLIKRTQYVSANSTIRPILYHLECHKDRFLVLFYFLLFINDLPVDCKHSIVDLCADDASIYVWTNWELSKVKISRIYRLVMQIMVKEF